jgi:uncharacterized protein
VSPLELNKAVLLSANAAIDRGDTEGFLSFCTDDIEWTAVGEMTLKGKHAVREWMTKAYVKPPKYTVENLIAEADDLVALGGILVEDSQGQATPHAYADVWRLRDGKLATLRAFVIRTTTEDLAPSPGARGFICAGS